MSALPARAGSIFARTGRQWPGRLAAGVAYASAASQAAVLTICAIVAGGSGTATVLHRVTPRYDVAAWYFPMPGPWGTAIVVVEILTILASMVMALSREPVKRRVGLVLMLSWGAFWAYRIARVAWCTHGAVDITLGGLALLALACQIVLTFTWWRSRKSVIVKAA